jgi:hypothetical protein
MKFLSDILAKAGLTVDGVVTLNNTATGQTPAANDNSTKLATTAWVRTFVQPYSLPIASASILGGIKVGTGLSIDSGTGILSVTGASASSIKSTQTFVVTEGQTVFTVTNGYSVGLIDIFLNGVYLSPNQSTATNGSTFTLNDAPAAGDIIDVIVVSPVYQGTSTTTDQLPEGVVNLYYTNARARAAITLTVNGSSGASTYSSSTGVLNVPTYTLAGLGGIGGSGTTGYVSKFTNSTTIGNSLIYDDGFGIGINTSSPYNTSFYSLDVNGALLVKNVGKTANITLINADPAGGGNNAFVIHTVGGTLTSSYVDIQGYYGASVTGSTTIRLNAAGGNILIGSLIGTGTRMVVASSTGILSAQAIPTISDLSGVPTSRTLTINGVTYDLTANRSWSALPVGGTAGQLLAKVDGTDYNAQWINEAPAASYTSQVKHRVKSSQAISKGQAVYVSSADGTNMIVSKASNATEGTSSKTMGLLESTVAINGTANVVTEGLIAGLDTTGANAAGDPVWLGTDGNLIYGLTNKPSAPAHLVFIGVVTRRNANNGEIFVKVQNGFELDELHDLSVKNASDGDMIKYVASTGLWTKIAASTTNIVEGTNLYYTDARVGTYLTNNSYATQTYVNTAVSNLVDAAPGTLDTLNELAAALGDDPNFATTVATSIGTKQAQLNGTGFVKVSGTTVSYDNSTYYLASNPNGYITGISFANVSAKPTTIAGYGITDSLVYTTSTYSNPSWITALAWSKITGAPAFITGYTETDTLATVTGRGASTSTTLNLDGRVNIGNGLTRPSALNSDSVAHARIGGSDVHLYVASLGAGGGYKVAVQAARTSDFQSFDLDLQSNGGTLRYGGNEIATRTWVQSQSYLTGITSSQVTTALGYTPWNFGSIDAARNIVSGTNLDTDLENGGAYSSYGAGGTSWNAPFSYGGVIGFAFTSGIRAQFGFDIRHTASDYGDLWYRTKNNVGYSTWRTMLHSANYSSYALPLTGGTLSGPLTINTTGDIVANSETFRMKGGGGSGEFIWYRNYSGSPSHPGFVIINRSGTTTFSHNSNGGGTSVSGNFSAANFSGSSSGTNTGDQTNISGNAGTVSSITGNTGLMVNRLTPTSLIDGLTTSNFRSTLFGTSANGAAIAAARWNSVPTPLSGMTMYGTMIAWSGDSDTHGFVSTNYETPGVTVGGGYGNFISWTKRLAFSDGTGVSGTWAISISGNADTVDGYHASGLLKLNEWNGNLYLHTDGRIYGTIFYDANDDAYYLNPNGNSVLTTATFNLNASSTLTLTSAGTNASMIRAGSGDELYIGGNGTWQMRFSGANVLMDNGGYLQNNESLRAPIFYDSQDTGYYLDPNDTSNLSRLIVNNAVSGAALLVGSNNTSRIINDNSRKALVINAEYYPGLHLNAYAGNNSTHGAYIVMSGNISGGYRLWTMGIANLNPGIFSIGYSDQQDGNGHYGVGDNWSGNDAHHGRLIVDTSGNTKIRGMLYVNGTSGGMTTGSAVIHAGNIGSQSVSYAATAGNANGVAWANVSGRPSALSQFSNDSGYITSSGSISGNAATATSASSAGTITGRSRGSFTVGGNVNTFYPVAFQIGSGSTGEQGISVLQIERGGYDEPGYSNYTFSTFHCRIRAKADGWGFGASYVQVEANAYTTPMLAEVTQQNQTSQLIVWLRGGCAYRWYDVEGGWGLNFSNPSGGNYSTFNGNAVYSPTTTNTIGGNFKYQQGWGNNYISGRLTAGNGITAQSQIIAALHSSAAPDYANPLWIWCAADNDAIVIQNTTAGGNPPKIYFRDTNGTIQTSNTLIRLRTSNSDSLSAWLNGSTWNVTGDVVAYASDKRLKENIKTIPNAIEKVSALSGVTFDWNTTSEKAGFVPKRKYDEIGVLAQDVQNVLPQAVEYAPFDRNDDGTSKSGENYLTVKYEKIVPLLIEAVKEQQAQIESQKSEIEELKDLVKQLINR